MTKKEIKEKINFLESLEKEEKFDDAYKEAESFLAKLFEAKKYEDIVRIYEELNCVPMDFEVAYSYNEVGKLNEAEEIYESILGTVVEVNNSSVLNNLASIKERKDDIEKAFNLIKKAYKIDKDDEVIKNNYERILSKIQEKEEIESLCKNSETFLSKETDWAVDKLKKFVSNVKKEKVFDKNKIPIPRWKFKVLIETDETKADLLVDQWLKRGYILKTDDRGSYNESIYEINPYLEKFLKKVIPRKLNKNWSIGIDNITIDNLEKINYFSFIEKIEKVNKKYRVLLDRDFNELVINYLLKNKKSTIILAGSFIELLFTYYCEKKKIKNISYSLNGRVSIHSLYECTLNDFLRYFEGKAEFKKNILSIGDFARAYRNLIHPGNEIKSGDFIDDVVFNLSFNASIEILKKIIR